HMQGCQLHLVSGYKKRVVQNFSCTLHWQRCEASLANGTRCPRSTCLHLPYCYFHIRTELQLEIKPSTLPNAGLGLFTLIARREGDDLGPYMAELLSKSDLDKRYSRHQAPYALQITADWFLDAACV